MKFIIHSPMTQVAVIEAPTWIDARDVAHKKFDEHHTATATKDNPEATIEVKWEGSDYTGKNEDRRHMLIREKKNNVWTEWSREC